MTKLLNISEAASMALHTMVLLAVRQDKLLSTRDIASALNVSEAHLAKVLQRLAKAGLVRSTRGPKGGFALQKAPHEITLRDVYEAMEGPLRPTDCLLASPVCGNEDCILGTLLGRVNQQVSQYLAGTRLSEVQHGLGRIYGRDQKNN